MAECGMALRTVVTSRRSGVPGFARAARGRCSMDATIRDLFPGTVLQDTDRPTRRTAPQVEAPDRGEWAREAPESETGRMAEAPDAGEGRASALEHDFTHGRSQS